MAAQGLNLSQPPVQPPEVTAQLGAGGGSPYAAMAESLRSKLASKSGAPTEDATSRDNPQGAMLAQSEAIKKVVDQMSKMNANFAPFGARIIEILNTGLNEALKAGQPGVTAPPGVGAQAPPPKSGSGDFPG